MCFEGAKEIGSHFLAQNVNKHVRCLCSLRANVTMTDRSVSLCVCVGERERERKRERQYKEKILREITLTKNCEKIFRVGQRLE